MTKRRHHFVIKSAALILIILLGIRIQHWAIIKGSMDLVPGDMGDSRFVNLLLEHAWEFASGSLFLTKGYWTAPWNFFPAANTLLMSDVIGGASWNYIVLRFIGFSATSAYQGWFLTTSAFNFLAAYFLARKFNFSFLASSGAGWIFAFSMIRSALLAHPQMTPHYFSILALLAAIQVVNEPVKGWRQWFWSAASGVSLGLQFWAAFYLVWFSILTGFLGLCVAIILWRSKTWLALLKYRANIMIGGLAFLAIAGPLTIKYYAMQGLVGGRDWNGILQFLPPLRALLLPPTGTWFHQGLYDANGNISPLNSEMSMFPGFLGFLAMALILIMWVRSQKNGAAIFCGLTWVMLMLATQMSCWHVIYSHFPGATAIRAVGRISIAGLLPLSLCMAAFTDHVVYVGRKWGPSWGRLLGGVILVAVILDNGYSNMYAFSKREHLRRVNDVANLVDVSKCKVFHYSKNETSYLVEIDSMWASMTQHVPTVNGYSGSMPVGFNAAEINSSNVPGLLAVNKWLELNGEHLSDESKCLVTYK